MTKTFEQLKEGDMVKIIGLRYSGQTSYFSKYIGKTFKIHEKESAYVLLPIPTEEGTPYTLWWPSEIVHVDNSFKEFLE
jgi:hypothetical protein